jgi:hypothetical protein
MTRAEFRKTAITVALILVGAAATLGAISYWLVR